MVTSGNYRHVPTGTLAVLAQRLGKVFASSSTWYRLVRAYGWRRPRLRVHPATPKVGLRTTRPDEMWHLDTTVIRLLDGTRAYLHAVIDNFSRRVLAWRVAETFAPPNSVAVLLDATRGAVGLTTAPVVLADAGVENVNAAVDALIETGVLRRLLAFTELRFSTSMIEAWRRSLKHQWLYLHSLDSVATIRRLVRFYVHEHSRTAALGVSRADARRKVLWQQRGGPGRADVTRGRRPPSTPRGQPIRVQHDVPVNQRGRMIPDADRPGDPELLCLDGITREPDRTVLWRAKTLSESDHLGLFDHALPNWDGENSRSDVQNVREESSAARPTRYARAASDGDHRR